MKELRWLLINQLKSLGKKENQSGFTLVELLVALLLAVLVITPLLGFMISILDNDRKEQAKATTEQDIKLALDYIGRDLKQAIYVYDNPGITAIKAQLPTVTDGVPVLVFWKRELLPQSVKATNTQQDDAFVYSLVVYYLISNTNPPAPWSKSARIARFQIRDGVLDKNGQTCTGYGSDKYSSINYPKYCPDQGFKIFDLTQKNKTLIEKMNSWTKLPGAAYTQNPIVLVDYIDQTTIAQAPSTAAPSCPPDFTQVPPNITRTGFYACVDPRGSVNQDDRSIVQVYLRGNALARINPDEAKARYSDGAATYFPSSNIRVEGSSFIFK
ncbi:MAG TPA: hormogonium polysaccharide secretion pseudopilin HpsC [Nostocaceae cyanobacterium]|nr:hormogonium polysaccharide secretion pseudopilin HpsC [Nostocaceae cyanobacterium]